MFNHRNRIGAGYEKSRLIKDFFFQKKSLRFIQSSLRPLSLLQNATSFFQLTTFTTNIRKCDINIVLFTIVQVLPSLCCFFVTEYNPLCKPAEAAQSS